VYRPNEAKVRNLKTKDYLGKARLVAASDRANVFTGFAGSEIKNVSKGVPPMMPPQMAFYGDQFANQYYLGQAGKTDGKDDRPTDNISFAATNLVKPNLQSRRQQSEPPVGRNVFPPTPPPESDKSGGLSRGQSVRNGSAMRPTPAKLNIPRGGGDDRFDKANSPPQRRPTRSNTGPPQRSYSTRERGRRDDEEGYNDDVYDMYQGGSRASRGQAGGQRRNMPRYIEEEEDEEGSDFDDGSFDEGEFEMVSGSRRTQGSMGSGRGQSRKSDVRKIRVKVHAEDVRYIMIGSAVEFADFVDRIRDKFGIRRRFKIKVRDEDQPNGDMITMGDQDDLDMVIMTAKSQARRQRQEVGKMEVSLCFCQRRPKHSGRLLTVDT
jgi:hypothetical protein